MAVRTLVKIVIPLYRLPLSQAEETAIKHTARILQSYPICLIIPEGLPKESLKRLIPQAEIMSVSKHWLGRENGIAGYNDMMCRKIFTVFLPTRNISSSPARRMDIQRRTGRMVPKRLRLHRRSVGTPRKIRQISAPIMAATAKSLSTHRHKPTRPFRQSGKRWSIFTTNKFIYRGLRKIRGGNYPIQETQPPPLQRRRILGDNSS